jgi:hypothetical protein
MTGVNFMATGNGTIGGLNIMGASEVPNDRGKWILHGQQGGGKSTCASTIAGLGKTLYVDLIGEKGIRSFAGAAYAKDIDVVRPTSILQLTDIYDALARGDGGYECVVVDSLTSVQKMAMRFMLGYSETAAREIQKGQSPADQRTWGQTLDIMTDFATFWFELADATRAHPLHVVMTSQTKLLEDEIAGEVTNRTLDVQKGALQITRATADYILYCEAEQDHDKDPDEDGNFPTRYVARFGFHPGYSTKARIPVRLRGKLPPFLGKKTPVDLTYLTVLLGIGGVPDSVRARYQPKAKAPATPAATTVAA